MTLRHFANCLIFLVILSNPSTAREAAQTTPDEQEPAKNGLDTVTVVGTRSERATGEVAANVSVIDAETLDRQIARDIADLVRYEPGVTVGGTGSRFGLDGFSIRGLGGNRVLTVVDGVRVAENFSFGPFLSARRDFVDIDSLDRAEIARGPVSALYGSDALGGVVAFTTRGPRDYLMDGEPFYGAFRGGYSDADESAVGTLTLAAGNDTLSAMLLYTQRDGNETDNQGRVAGFGPSRERPDPMAIESNNVLAKLSVRPGENHSLTLSIDRFDSDTNTRIFSDYGLESFGTVTNRRDAIDNRLRSRISAGYTFDGDLRLADRLNVTVYTQDSETEQTTDEDRTSPGNQRESRVRNSFFEQKINGAFVQLNKQFEIGDSEHLLTYGIDLFETENNGLRDGASFDANGAVVPPSPFAPILPTRDFPHTEVRQTAVFLQDEISLLNDRLLLSPGIRYDRFEAEAVADDVYLDGNPGTPLPENYEDSEVTAKLGAVYAFTDVVSAYASVSQGFRAPPYSDVNVGFSNFIGGYKTIANPELKAERSQSVEVGLRLQGEVGSLSVGVFDTSFDNFVESFAIAPALIASGGIDPADGLLTFQSLNRDEVEIKGAELSAMLALGSLMPALQRFSLRAAVAYAEGEDTQNNQPINSIEPLTTVLGASYRAASDRWGAELVWTIVDGKEEEDIDANNPRFAAAGYATLDLLGDLRLSERVGINVGLFNLTDKTYIRWADTAGIGNDATARFTQPGFNAGVNVRVEF